MQHADLDPKSLPRAPPKYAESDNGLGCLLLPAFPVLSASFCITGATPLESLLAGSVGTIALAGFAAFYGLIDDDDDTD